MNEKNFRVGYARRDITPDFSVPLAGYGNTMKRMSQGWYSHIYATCLAFTDENDETLLVFTTDLIVTRAIFSSAVRKAIFEATGIAADHINISATHTHSAPDVLGVIGEGHPYFDLYVRELTQAALDALADRAPATATAGQTQVQGLGFVRHFLMSDGSIRGDNYGTDVGKTFVGYTMPNDDQMQLVRFAREEKQDVLMVNWQAHPTVGSTSASESGQLLRPFIGADYVGSCRDAVEKKTGVLFAFFQGASGNVNSRSRIVADSPTTDVHKYGQQLAEFVFKGMEDMHEVQLGKIQACSMIYTGKLDHSEDPLVPQALLIQEEWLRTNDLGHCIEFARPYGIHSPYHANAIISRSRAEETQSTELAAATMGQIGFAFAPYEMFCNNGQAIKEGSACPVTFVAECSNDNASYIGSKEAYDHGCYEVDMRRFVRGTGEEMAQCFVDMLNQMQ